VSVGTRNVHFGVFGNSAYDFFGAHRNARAATRALLGIHNGKSQVFIHRNGVVLATFGAASEPHAPHLASLVSARYELCRLAIAVSLIGAFVAALVSAYAMHNRNRFFALFLAHTEYASYVGFVHRACGIALRRLGFALKESFGKRRATGISAPAAIRARKIALYLVYASVAVYGEFFAEKAQTKRKYRGKHAHREHGQDESHEKRHITLPLFQN
jgi:hypothetical protein